MTMKSHLNVFLHNNIKEKRREEKREEKKIK